MLLEDFNHTIDAWIKALTQYDFIALSTKPSPNSWSLGQVYMHLIAETRFYIEQIKICLAGNDHAMEEASPEARTMLLNNEFPDAIIEGPPTNAFIPQPRNKEELISGLINIKEQMNDVKILIAQSPFKGKTKHPGLNYLDANGWLQFAEMHLRHHLRQKKRIDAFLQSNKY